MEEHGGNIWNRLRQGELAVSGKIKNKILDFSANINPLGLPPDIVRVIRKNIPALIHYPHPQAGPLRKQISKYIHLDQDHILAGNGTTQLMYLIYRVFKPGSVIIPVPSFSEYEKAVSGANIYFHQLKSNNGFCLDVNRLLEDIERKAVSKSSEKSNRSMVVLGNPNNPIGNLIPVTELISLVRQLYKRRIWLVLDEAFIDFVKDDHKHSLISRVSEYSNLIVLRTLTKFFALPGLRIGYAVSSKKNISVLSRCIEPWSVNHLAQTAGMEILKQKDYIKQSHSYIVKEYKYLYSQLKKISFLEPYPSAVNFIMCKIKPDNKIKDSHHLTSSIEKKGILIRNCANFRNLGSRYIRVAVRSRSENKLLIQGFRNLKI
ncbi:MAG: threonine-phosphate decarboxylase [Candidatus Omnitrophica bacterium]|nr:threonine-phosphate decarboxylase [Candidatus Omnitrophota bacterium]